MKIDKDKHREELLYKAACLFAEKGYRGCSVKDLSESLCLSRGGLYHHFSSKEELYLEACQIHCKLGREILENLFSQKDITLKNIMSAIESLFKSITKNKLQVRLRLDFQCEAMRSESLESKRDEFDAQWISAVEAIVQLMRSKNFITTKLKDSEVTVLCTLFIEGLLLKHYKYSSSQKMAKEFFKFLQSMGVLAPV